MLSSLPVGVVSYKKHCLISPSCHVVYEYDIISMREARWNRTILVSPQVSRRKGTVSIFFDKVKVLEHLNS